MESFDELIAIMSRLRAPGGCPWDREQTHRSIRKYVIEEAYEVAEAIDRDDPAELCAELGDLLLQVVFHAEMALEAGRFSVDDVCRGIVEKMRRRHPHVFGDVEVDGAAQVVRNWEEIKKRERGADASAIDGVPRALPSLQRAERIGEKASRVGFDWPDVDGALAKLDEELREFERARDEAVAAPSPTAQAAIADELGDVLFVLVRIAGKLGQDAESVLAGANEKFERRFGHVLRTLAERGVDPQSVDLAALDRLWDDAKRAERSAASRS